MTRDEQLDRLRSLLRDVLEARFAGCAHQKLARAHGYADGYMRALLDAGAATRRDLIEIVCEERRRFIADGSVSRATVAA